MLFTLLIIVIIFQDSIANLINAKAEEIRARTKRIMKEIDTSCQQ